MYILILNKPNLIIIAIRACTPMSTQQGDVYVKKIYKAKKVPVVNDIVVAKVIRRCCCCFCVSVVVASVVVIVVLMNM